MRTWRRSLAVLAILGLLPCLAQSAGVQTNFAAGAVLSSSDVDKIVKLARTQDMSNVAEITTTYLRPGRRTRVISVRGDEITDGRKTTYELLRVEKGGWNPRPPPSSGRTVVSVGEFWVTPTLELEKHTEALCKTPKGQTRVEIPGDMAIETADKIVQAFAARKIRFADESVRDKAEPETLTQPRVRMTPDYDHPTSIERAPESPSGETRYRILFIGVALDELEIEVMGDEVKIISFSEGHF